MNTATEQKSIADFIREQQISMAVEYADSNPHIPDSDNMDHWRCKLVNRSRGTRMTVYFSKGYGHNGKQPDTGEVLDCLAMDASGIENAQSLEDWCNEYGYDTDSRRAEKTYNTVLKQAVKLRNLLGDDAFEELLWSIERQ